MAIVTITPMMLAQPAVLAQRRMLSCRLSSSACFSASQSSSQALADHIFSHSSWKGWDVRTTNRRFGPKADIAFLFDYLAGLRKQHRRHR
jgi:hypothetical protein